ncbi:MAG: ATP synthase F1 subunit epsilon [Ruminococcus sp.]|nr:ATP synthase F1 subunit epsilon [Ruminococcus sp.]
MSNFNLKVITPEKIFYDGEVAQLTVRTTEGDEGFLAHHINYCAILPSGEMKVKFSDGSIKFAAISMGTIKFSNNTATILASACEWSDEIDLEWAKRSEEDARKRLQEHNSDQEFKYADLKLKRALNRISVGSKK